MKYVFGPVPSRRLGQSLGIDPVVLKTCNWSCVYCQLGRTSPFVSERKDYVPVPEILKEIRNVLNGDSSLKVDWISIVGSGEPLLHSRIGELIDGLKALTKIPIALITNGALLSVKDVRESVLGADAVFPTVDAGSEEMFRKVNRPHPGITFDQFVQGLEEFRRVYKQKLWPEVMLVRGLNDSEDHLKKIAGFLKRIGADEVYINVPVRISAESWVQSPDAGIVARAEKIFGEVCPVTSVHEGSLALNRCENLSEAIVNTVSRHPMSGEDIEKNLKDWAPSEIREALELLRVNARVQCVERSGVRFWTAAGSRYPD